MIYNTYLYLVLTFLAIFFILYLFFYLRPNKNNINNKILLKNLLESFDLELPEELKRLDNSSAGPQKLS